MKAVGGVLLGLALVTFASADVRGQQVDPTTPRPAPSTRPSVEPPEVRLPGVPTRMGQEQVLPSQVIAVVRVVSVSGAGIGAVLARVVVTEGLWAAPGHSAGRGDELVLLTYPGHVVADVRELMFLRRIGRGDRYELVFRVAEHDEHYASKLAVARQTMVLGRIPDVRARADATVEWMLDALQLDPGGPGDARQQPLALWWARYALDELGWMVREQPWVFRPGDAVRIERAGARWADSDLGPRVESVAEAVRAEARRLYAPPEKAPSSR